MCVIIVMPPNAQINKDHLFNSVYNNWHSYGLILKDQNSKLQVLKDCPEGGNDPELIWKLLEDNKDVERILHLRHNTRGATNMMNAQPFPVYNSSTREVWFMHNGTLYEYGTNSQMENAKSDTLDFCEKIIQPALLRWRGEGGDADYNDPEFKKLIMDKRWNHTSRGLFISNFGDNLYYGEGWKDYKQEDKDAPVIKISNDEYFTRVTRGPFFEKQQEEARKARMLEESTTTHTAGGEVSKGMTFRIKEFSEEDIKKSRKVLDVLEYFYDDETDVEKLEKLALVDYFEWCHFVQTNHNFYTAGMLSAISDALAKVMTENEQLNRKIERMHKHISEQKLKEIEEVKAA